ncbi:Dynactin-associated protein, partial [Galemys pyrenaicus]
MDRKHGKYMVNVEHSGSQPPITCSNDQAVHSSACWRPHSDDLTIDSTGVCMSSAVPSYSEYPHTELCNTEVKGSCCNNWSLWKVFLSCLLACLITTAIGVLIICLVNNRGNSNSSVVIQLPSNNGGTVVIVPGTSSTASQPAVTSSSMDPTTTTASPESTTTVKPTVSPTVSITTVATNPTSTETTSTTATATTVATNPTSTQTTSTTATASRTTTGLPRNPYCSNEGAHCSCRLPNVTFQPQWVTPKPWSLWKTFLVCLLACIIAAALVVLVLYFVHFGKLTNGSTNIIIHTDGKSSPVTCISGSTTSPASPTLPGSQNTLPSTPAASQSSPSMAPPSALGPIDTTVDHKVDI